MAVPYLDHPRPVAFAHRGGAAHNPENSWPAFEYAAKLGYAYLETDARATSDGALLSFHDATLDRVTDRTGQVAKMTYRQVSAARIAGKEPIPLIEDLLGTFGELRFNIDLKDGGTIAPLAQVLKRTGAWDRVCVTSFSGRRLLAAQKILDRPVCLAVTPAAIAAVRYAGFPGRAMAARLARSGAQCAQVPRRIATREFIRRAHELGLHVHVWTLNGREEIERVLDLGADGVMTDDVVLLRDILTERGQWNPRVALLALLPRGDDPLDPASGGNTIETRLDTTSTGNLVRVSSVADRDRQPPGEAVSNGRTRTTRNPTRCDELRERPEHGPGTPSGRSLRLPERAPL